MLYENIFYVSNIYISYYTEYLRFTPDLLYRGGADEAAGGRHQVPLLLADAGGGVQGGGPARPLPRPRHAARAPDPQHGHHDGHLRAHGLHAPPDLLHQLVLARHRDDNLPLQICQFGSKQIRFQSVSAWLVITLKLLLRMKLETVLLYHAVSGLTLT